MFTPLSLLASSTRCPDFFSTPSKCTRSPCPLSHQPNLPPPDCFALLGLPAPSRNVVGSAQPKAQLFGGNGKEREKEHSIPQPRMDRSASSTASISQQTSSASSLKIKSILKRSAPSPEPPTQPSKVARTSTSSASSPAPPFYPTSALASSSHEPLSSTSSKSKRSQPLVSLPWHLVPKSQQTSSSSTASTSKKDPAATSIPSSASSSTSRPSTTRLPPTINSAPTPAALARLNNTSKLPAPLSALGVLSSSAKASSSSSSSSSSTNRNSSITTKSSSSVLPSSLSSRTGRPPTALPPLHRTSTTRPTLKLLPNQTIVPIRDRQAVLNLIFDTFSKLYSSIPHLDGRSLAGKHALEQEEEGYRKCGGKGGYKNTMSNILIALKKRPPPPSSTLSLSDPLLGTQSTYLVAQAALARSSAVASLLSAAAIAPFILSPKDLVKWEYVTEVPSTLGGSRPHSEGETQTCSRCDKAFVVPPGGVASLESEGDEEAREKSKCWYHHGRRRWSKERDGTRSQVATCCGGAWTGQGCTTGRSHVWKEEDVGVLNERVGFVRTEELESNRGAGRGKGREKMVLVGCDCEMIYTTAGMSLARVTLVDENCRAVLDELVRIDPASVLDTNTRFSGIHPVDVENASMTLPAVREAIGEFLGPDTVMVGHGLENDLNALRLIHSKIIDTAILFPHSLGPPYRPALRDLASKHLQMIIQNAGDAGHSSAEDAEACIRLLRYRVENAGMRL